MLDITPTLSRGGQVPVYLQIYGYIRTEIEAGRIREGERLPSIRALADHLKLSKNTVETAYLQLVAEGYAESRERSGLFVRYEPDGIGDQAAQPKRTFGRDAAFDRSSGSAPAVRYDFRYGDPSIEGFPFRAWKRCLNEALFDADSLSVLGYGEPQGDAGLREEIAAYLFQSRGVACAPDQLFIAAGTQNAVDFVCKFLGLAGEAVMMEEPGYAGVRAVLESNGCRVVPVAVEEDGIDTAQVMQSMARAVYVTPSHQFPLGMVMSIQKRMDLLKWAEHTGGIVIEDDYDSEFRYRGQPVPALKSLDYGDRVVYVGTFSKSFLPSARISYIAVPATMAGEYRRHMSRYNQAVSPLLQRALRKFMSEGHFARHVRRMRRIYQTKHSLLIDAIEAHMGDRAKAVGHDSGLHLLLKIQGRGTDELVRSAADAGIRVYSPDVHWLLPPSSDEARIMLGFGGLRTQDIDEAVAALANVWGLHAAAKD